MTIEQAYKAFIDSRYINCEECSIDYYRENLERFFKFYCGEYGSLKDDVNCLTAEIQEAYIKQLRNQVKFDSHPMIEGRGKLSNVTIRTYYIAIKVFIEWLINEGIYTSRSKNIRLPKANPKAIVPLYTAEVELLESVTQVEDILNCRNRVIIYLMLEAGARSKEVCNIRMSDIYWSKNIIILTDTKNGLSRPIPMSVKLESSIRRYLSLCPERGDKDYLLTSIKQQQQLTYNTIRCMFDEYRRKTGIDRLHAHLLRHTFATSYIYYGGELLNLSYLMGHTSITMTQKYVHLANTYRLMMSDVYKLDELFYKKK